MKQKHLIFLIAAMLLISTATATTTYENIGSANQQYELDRGAFSIIDEDDINTFTAGFTQTKRYPAASDLDNDGLTEFYVFDSDDIEVYEGKELTFVASVDFGNDERISFPIIYDVNGDGNKEIVFALEESLIIRGYNFNGTNLNQIINFSYAGLSDAASGETMIACKATNDCIITYTDTLAACSGSEDCKEFSMAFFNSTDTGGSATLQETGGVSSNDRGMYCRSGVPLITVDDYDVDGTTEYIFSFGAFSEIQASVNEAGVYVYWVESSSNSVSTEQFIFIDREAEDDPFDIDGASECTEADYQNVFTSPLVEDSLSNDFGSEIVIAYQTTPEEFRMDLYDKDGTFIDDFPETDDSNGNIISNPFLADAFPESVGDVDFCIVGYNRDLAAVPDEFKQLITCGSKFKSGLAESAEYEFTFPQNIFNVTTEYEIANTIAHSVQHSNAQTDGVDLTEVLTTYGVYTLDDSTCQFNILGKDLCDSSEIFSNDNGNGFSMGINADGGENDDIVIMTNIALFYIDDGIGNQPPDSVIINTNPCVVDSVVKQNTNLQITVTAEDGNDDFLLANDDLTINVSIYDGKSYVQRQGANNITSGSPKQFFFTANVTGTSEVIRVEVTDNFNSPVVNSETTFTVGSQGLEFGSGSCDITLLEDVEIVDGVVVGQIVDIEGNALNNNSVNRGLVEYSQLIGVSATVVWVLLMLFIGIAIFVAPEINRIRGGMGVNFNLLAAMVFLFEGFMIILGGLLGILGVGLIIIFSVLMLTALGIWVGRLFTSQGMNM